MRSAFDVFWRPAVPEARLAALRILVGGYGSAWVCLRTPMWLRLSELPPAEFHPLGVVALLTEAPVPPPLLFGCVAGAALLGALFAAGRLGRISGPGFALLLLWVTTYASSFGKVFHTENLLVLHAGILALSPAGSARLSGDRKGPGFGGTVRLMAWVTALTYLLAGVAKLRETGIVWATGDTLLVNVARDALRKSLIGSAHSPLGVFSLAYPAVFTPLAVLSLALELGAPACFCFRRAGRLWAAAAWSFHVGVLALMAIAFPYALSGVAFAPFFRVERLPLLRRKAAASPGVPGRAASPP